VWAVGSARDSTMLLALAYVAFLLNAFNMIPIGFLDGGQVFHSMMEAWRMPVIQFEGGVPMQAFAPDRTRALVIGALYAGLATALVAGMLATKHAHGL
jgi:Zn-dependent protease